MNKNIQLEDLLSMLSEPQKLAELLNHSESPHRDLLSQSSSQVMAIAKEYARLASLPCRSQLEEDRIDEILEVANYSDVLGFWIVEVDHLVGHYLGLLDEDHRESYRDQQALLKDYVGIDAMICRTPFMQEDTFPTFIHNTGICCHIDDRQREYSC